MQETYLRHLERLKVMSPEEVSQQKERLIASTPGKEWPYGFPASLDPRLVIIGVSPGNSPYKPKAGEESKRFLSEPGVINGEESHYYYPDTRRYWNKIRFWRHLILILVVSIFRIDALRTTHINLKNFLARLRWKMSKMILLHGLQLGEQDSQPGCRHLVGVEEDYKEC